MNSFRELHQPTGRIISQDHKDYLFFGGTAYLGLLDHPEYIALYKEGIDRYGLNNGTSRTNNVQLGIYDEAERVLAQRFGFESAALFSSGYLAAQATVQVLSSNHGEVIYAPHTHPALWIAGNPNTSEVNFNAWAKDTVAYINSSVANDFVIISNSLDNLTPEIYDFTFLKLIQPDKRVLLMIDESHSIAVIRKDAVSVDIDKIIQPNISVVVLASLAKGLGTDAGIVLASEQIISTIKSNPIFTGASPSAPAAVYALINGLEIYDKQFIKLQQNIADFTELIKVVKSLNFVSNFPVFTSNSPVLYQFLIENEVLISSFPYPLSTSPLLNRVVISALHSREDLVKLANLLLTES